MTARVGVGLAENHSERALDRWIRSAIVATLVVDVVYLSALLLPGAPATALIDIGLSVTAQWVPALGFWLVAVRTRFSRGEVILASVAVTANAFGDTFYAIAANSSGYLPSPSLADLGYLLYYPFMMAALIVLCRRQSRGATRSVIVDSALTSLGAIAVLIVLLQPIFVDARGGSTALDSAVAALYPLFDVLLVAVVVSIAASSVLRLGARWQFLVGGLLLITGADVAYAFLEHEGAYSSGTPLDAAWAAGTALTALWVVGVDHSRPAPAPVVTGIRLLPLPAFGVLAGAGVLLFATQMPVSTLALVPAAAAVTLSAVPVIVRHAALARLLEGQALVVEQLTQLDKAKSDMIGTMSHEMRTPLTSIVGYLELVLDDQGESLPEEAREMLQVVDRNARRLQSLVGNMLVITTLESGAATPPAVSIQVDEVLRRSVESLQPFADAQNVALRVVRSEAMTTEGDASQLERAFTNLMENAVKFTPSRGCVDIESVAGTTSSGSPAALITVADTGMGIPEKELPHLFDRFFRASNAQHQAVPGTGLGLSIVREIIRSHHGDISVVSVLGEGTTFLITLPAASAP